MLVVVLPLDFVAVDEAVPSIIALYGGLLSLNLPPLALTTGIGSSPHSGEANGLTTTARGILSR